MAHAYDHKELLAEATRTFEAFLADSGMRRTPERMEILRTAFDMKAHFGVDQVHRRLEEAGYHVSRATVYNTVELLVRSGVLRRHIFETHQARYEVGGASHFHLVCTVCGRVTEADARMVSRALASMDTRGFTPAYFSGTVYGLCSSCSRKARLKADKVSLKSPAPPGAPK